MPLRRARGMNELLEDSGFPYHVGQLIGAAEMAAFWMQMHPDQDTKDMGTKLSESVNWFFKDSKGRGKIDETIQT